MPKLKYIPIFDLFDGTFMANDTKRVAAERLSPDSEPAKRPDDRANCLGCSLKPSLHVLHNF